MWPLNILCTYNFKIKIKTKISLKIETRKTNERKVYVVVHSVVRSSFVGLALTLRVPILISSPRSQYRDNARTVCIYMLQCSGSLTSLRVRRDRPQAAWKKLEMGSAVETEHRTHQSPHPQLLNFPFFLSFYISIY